MRADWWQKFISLESSENIETKRKKLVTYAFSYIGGAVAFLFSMQEAAMASPFLQWSLIVSGIYFYINALLSHIHHRITLTSILCGIGAVPLGIAIVVSGGYENTGLYWIYPFPIVLFILFGYGYGLIVNTGFFVAIWLSLINQDIFPANYRDAEISRFLVSLAVNIAFCMIAEYFRFRSFIEMSSINFDKQRQANTDPLTKLPNRRFVDSVFLDSALKDPANHLPMTVVAIDIDYFKNVNDSYGHDVGDRVLKHVAKTIRSKTRESDVVARTGGEEFLALFPKSSLQIGIDIAEKTRIRVESSPYQHNSKVIATTVSLGIAQATHFSEIDSALREADAMLYKAKNNGRNRIEYN